MQGPATGRKGSWWEEGLLLGSGHARYASFASGLRLSSGIISPTGKLVVACVVIVIISVLIFISLIFWIFVRVKSILNNHPDLELVRKKVIFLIEF